MRRPLSEDIRSDVVWTGQSARIDAPKGSAVLAPAKGRILKTFRSKRHGWAVTLQHDGEPYVSAFTHLAGPPPVRQGQRVNAGDVLGHVGLVGSQGYQLRWQLMERTPNKRSGFRLVDPRELIKTPEAKLGGLMLVFTLAMGALIWWDDGPGERSPRH